MRKYDYVDEMKSLPINEVATRLGLNLSLTGHSLQGHCPTGHSSKNGKCFSINIKDNFFNCFHCGTAGDVISLVELVNQCDFIQAVGWLAKEFNIAIPGKIKERAKNDNSEFYLNASFYDEIFSYGKYLLHSSEGAGAREYLINERGIDKDKLKETEWILLPPDDIVKSRLRTLFPDAEDRINRLYLNSFKEPHDWAAFPYRNRNGIITGFLMRALNPAGYNLTTFNGNKLQNHRWHSTSGTSKHDLFNLHQYRDQDMLLILEGYPDAIYLPTVNILNVVAVGQGKLSESHLEGLDEFNVKSVIISFDNDAAGLENTKLAIKLLLTKSRINVFIIDPTLLGQHKDPDEYVRGEGADAFSNIIANAESGAEWLAKQITYKTSIEKQKSLDDAAELAGNIINSIASEVYVKAVATQLSLSIDAVKEHFSSLKERKERARINKAYKKLEGELEYLRSKGDLEGAAKLIEEKGTALKNDLYKTKIQPVSPLSDRLRDKYNQEKNRTGELLGLPLTKFSELSRNIDGLQSGLYLIGAETNVGKTAMLTNLSLDVLQTNQDSRILYFSMDDSWNVITNRFLGILTEIDLNMVQRRQGNDGEKIKMKGAYDFLIDLSETDRLQIKDISEVSNYDQIEAVIRESVSDDFAVFLDGLYNVEVNSSGKGIREANIDRANKLKTLVDTYTVPIICTAELRKKTRDEGNNKAATIHDFMETGKFGYNANVAWILSSKYGDAGDPEIPVTLKYEKNKLSHFKGGQDLIFVRSKGIIKEGDLVIHELANKLAYKRGGNGDFN